MNLTKEFKEKVRAAILQARENYGGSDADYAKKLGIKHPIYSRLKNGETDRILSDTTWITIGRELDVKVYEDKWKTVRTSVYNELEDNLQFCKELSKSMILANDCGIEKSYCIKNISKKMKNTFYVDCSQAKTKSEFIRMLAKVVGIDNQGKLY